MTTKFCSKHGAIIQGLDYAGRSDLHKDDNGNSKYLEDILKNQEIKVVDDVISHFGHVHEDSLMIEFLNSDKKICRIATTKFMDGFDLWLIHPESGAAVRT